jgi:hypothetical protein
MSGHQPTPQQGVRVPLILADNSVEGKEMLRVEPKPTSGNRNDKAPHTPHVTKTASPIYIDAISTRESPSPHHHHHLLRETPTEEYPLSYSVVNYRIPTNHSILPRRRPSLQPPSHTIAEGTKYLLLSSLKMSQSSDFNMLRLEEPRAHLQITDGSPSTSHVEIASPATWL